jgi:hypothetical protein
LMAKEPLLTPAQATVAGAEAGADTGFSIWAYAYEGHGVSLAASEMENVAGFVSKAFIGIGAAVEGIEGYAQDGVSGAITGAASGLYSELVAYGGSIVGRSLGAQYLGPLLESTVAETVVDSLAGLFIGAEVGAEGGALAGTVVSLAAVRWPEGLLVGSALV